MWDQPEPPPEPTMPPSINWVKEVTDPSNIITNGNDIEFPNGGIFYIQASFTIEDNISSNKYYCYAVEPDTQQIVAGTGGFVEGFTHLETFTFSCIWGAPIASNIQFKVIDMNAAMSGVWKSTTVNVVKLG